MTTAFISEGIWPRLTKAAVACRSTALVAVAYLGKGAANLLPLTKGSRLVVDASEANVVRGATCPADLLKLHKSGVRVFHAPNLHAKVYVFGKTAFIGSANASKHSGTLTEALVRTTDRKVTAAARRFIVGLDKRELLAEELKHLKELYNPPRSLGGKKKRAPQKKSAFAPMRIVRLSYADPPKGSKKAEAEGRREASERRVDKKTAQLDEFFNEQGAEYKLYDTVLQVINESNGRTYVFPILHIKKWSNGRKRCTFYFLEIPKRRRRSLKRMVEILGPGSRKRLQRDGRVNAKLASKIRLAWQ
jgi:hypothetical protein